MDEGPDRAIAHHNAPRGERLLQMAQRQRRFLGKVRPNDVAMRRQKHRPVAADPAGSKAAGCAKTPRPFRYRRCTDAIALADSADGPTTRHTLHHTIPKI